MPEVADDSNIVFIIAEFLPEFSDGRVRRINDFAALMASRGHATRVLSFGASGSRGLTNGYQLEKVAYPGLRQAENFGRADRSRADILGLITGVVIGGLVRLSASIPIDRYLFGVPRIWLQLKKLKSETLIVFSGPRFSIFIAAVLHAKKKKQKLVFDFRDLWIGNPIFYQRLFDPIARFIYQKSLSKADAVLVTTSAAAARIAGDIPQSCQLHVVPNGLSSRDAAVLRSLNQPLVQQQIPTCVAYFGNLGGSRECINLLRALGDQDITFRAYGRLDDKHRSVLRDGQAHPPIESRNAYLAELSRPQWALVVITEMEHHEYAIPGKVYEIMATGNPIFLYCPPNSAVVALLNRIDYPFELFREVKTNGPISKVLSGRYKSAPVVLSKQDSLSVFEDLIVA